MIDGELLLGKLMRELGEYKKQSEKELEVAEQVFMKGPLELEIYQEILKNHKIIKKLYNVVTLANVELAADYLDINIEKKV